MPKQTSPIKTSPLDAYCVNLIKKAEKNKIDTLIGRISEIERMTQILCRRTKNNPLLVGDPGVGKTAIVEGLANKIFTEMKCLTFLKGQCNLFFRYGCVDSGH